MLSLPDEIWTDILDYLDPHDIVSTQQVSQHLLKVARDSRLWRYKCFEKAPSAAQIGSERPNALSVLTGALGGLSLDGQTEPLSVPAQHNSNQQTKASKRARAVAEWDHSDATENVSWYSEYIGRYAPLSVEWPDRHKGLPEVRGMALYQGTGKVITPLDDGSIQVWDIEQSQKRKPRLIAGATSKTGLLFQNLTTQAGAGTKGPAYLGHAVENISIDRSRNKAYVVADNFVNEIDIERLQLVSQHSYAWPVTALSQESSGTEFNLTIGTSWSLHIHDPRVPLGGPSHVAGVSTTVDTAAKVDPTIAFLPNYTKIDVPQLVDGITTSFTPLESYSDPVPRSDLRAYARVEPGPQSIIHRGASEIIIAGRMSSILFYDRRFFPRLKASRHSGARLSSITTLPFAPAGTVTENVNQETLIACGEYGGCGSLEIYGLSETESETLVPSSLQLKDNVESDSGRRTSTSPQQAQYVFKNRQTASSSKLLSVCSHGTRILFSDAEGQLKWVERDGRGLARRWNINAASYTFTRDGRQTIGGLTSRTQIIRKMVPLNAVDDTDSMNVRGDDDILVWTGEKIGIVTYKSHWDSSWAHDDLVEAFESKLNLNDEDDKSLSENEERAREQEYSLQMRRALERQADERRWMSRFGGRWR